jgi:pyruvate formate lyase activating enzyme
MNFGGMVKNSFVDYPDKLACVFFTTGCNFRCWYCHNSHLFYAKPDITEQSALAFLEEHRGFLDAVVVSGGEPTLQKDLKEFVSKAKAMGYLVKLDTNGTSPEVLKDLVDSGLLDCVAMDIKAPLEKYEMVVGKTDKMKQVMQSIGYLLHQNKVDYEFRTTFSSDLSLDDLEEICKEVVGAKNFSIQKCNFVEYNEKNLPLKSKEELLKGLEIAKKYIKNAILKGVD